MLSSTFKELKEHRKAVIDAIIRVGLFPDAMEHDAAIAHLDIIESSLAKVNRADAYVGLISFRYGQPEIDPARNPKALSTTELEYERAEQRDLPRCMFLMHPDHMVKAGQSQTEPGTEGKLKAFRDRARKGRIVAEFCSVDDLKANAIQSLYGLKAWLDEKHGADPAGDPPTDPPPPATIPAPPEFYAKPRYSPGRAFVGRAAELDILRAWAADTKPVLVFEAIGGMGKSQLTWEWVQKHATTDRPGWAGMLWYSFYERGATMRDFCLTALAYITARPPETFKDTSTTDLETALLARLRQKSFLLVLDGLERVLVAYNRIDAAQAQDEDVDSDPEGLGRKPRDCIRPGDDALLRQLADAAPSKLLISTRLLPVALTDHQTRLPLPGVRHENLGGLDSEDAVALLTGARVTGTPSRMRRFLTNFANHPLVIGAIAGLVLNYMPAQGDFDRWLDDPEGGGSVNLATMDLRQRRTHILKLAFDGLTAEARELLSRLALVANAADYTVLEALNPKRPDPPEKVAEPEAPDEDWDFEAPRLQRQIGAVKTDKERGDLEQRLRDHQQQRQAEYEAKRRDFLAWPDRFAAWQRSEPVRAARQWLNETLADLQTRGLLQYDRVSRQFDLHPVVRGYAVGGLDADKRGAAGQRVADYFSSRPDPPFEHATSLADLANTMQVVQALTMAGKLNEAEHVLTQSFMEALGRLELHHACLALLQRMFPNGWDSPPGEVDNADWVAAAAANALTAIGLTGAAAVQDVFAIREGAKRGLSTNLSVRLRNYHLTLWKTRGLARAERVLALARDVAAAESAAEELLWCDLSTVDLLRDRGAIAEARARWGALAARADWPRQTAQLQAQAQVTEVWLLQREATLTEARLQAALDRVRALHQNVYERMLWRTTGEWRLTQGQPAAALEAFDQASAMARAVDLFDGGAEAGACLALARLGRRADAAARAARAEWLPHDTAAELYWELGDRAKAREHALAGYKDYWADGPPYAFHRELQTCRTVLQALGEPEPPMPPYDPANIQPLEFEADIRRLLDEHAAKQREKDRPPRA